MLTITVPADEYWDEHKCEFVTRGKDVELQLEHSLISIHKWEQKWHKPFLASDKSGEELVDYIRCMTITQHVPQDIYYRLGNDNMARINSYIADKHTATWFSDNGASSKGGSGQILTAEMIYYYMIALQIPPEYAKWHINSLLTLIEVCNRENARLNGKGPKKSKVQQAQEMRALNEQRRQKFNTRG